MNIDKIEITENNISFVILPSEKKVYLEGKYYDITESEIDNLIRIIRTWDSEYVNNDYFDGNRFRINIYYEGKVDCIKGVRGYPDNYEEFTKFVRSIYERR